MKKTTLLFMLFILLLPKAQIVTGKILSSETRQPVPYAKIAIENESVGAIADAKGIFTIDLNSIDKNKILRIEVGGFESYTTPVRELIQKNTHELFLKEKIRDIEEVSINPKKFVQKNWGIRTKTQRVLIGHYPAREKKDRSKEMAMLFKTNRLTKIEKININIATFKADKPVFIRFTVYNKDLQPVLNEDLTDQITAEKIKNGTYSFDVSQNNIWIDQDFYVGIQLLNYFEGVLYISGAFLGNKTIYRNYLEAWQNIPAVSPAINLDVKVQK